MKLPRLIALHFGLTAVLLATPMAVLADAKNQMIDEQQKMTQEEMDAAKKTAPANDLRPAATTTQSKHSVESPKGDMIKKNQKAVDKATDDATAATPSTEKRPAVTTDYK